MSFNPTGVSLTPWQGSWEILLHIFPSPQPPSQEMNPWQVCMYCKGEQQVEKVEKGVSFFCLSLWSSHTVTCVKCTCERKREFMSVDQNKPLHPASTSQKYHSKRQLPHHSPNTHTITYSKTEVVADLITHIVIYCTSDRKGLLKNIEKY